jgi:peptidoglycan hydrolase-like protein with peptidoglycan-binding domain
MKINLSTTYPLLIYGDNNLEVEKLQILLKKKGLYQGKITGIYGEDTLKAVVTFKVRLKMRDNSVVTSGVWKALKNECP